MGELDTHELEEFVNKNIVTFHEDKLKSLRNLGLKRILKSKNPYLFKAKNITLASDFVKEILDAFLSSSEEKIFGDFLETLAIFVAERTRGGWKSSTRGIDLEFIDKAKNVHYLISVKSGPNWGNVSQQRRQQQDFEDAVKTLKQSRLVLNVTPVLGICYGKTRTAYVRGAMKVVGQNFWYLISKNKNLYTDIIEPIGYEAKRHTEEFIKERDSIINSFTHEFMNDFCDGGYINWTKLVEFNSGNFDLPDEIF